MGVGGYLILGPFSRDCGTYHWVQHTTNTQAHPF